MFVEVKGEMEMKSRWQMLDMVIARFGFEADVTIDFAYLCEYGTNQQVAESFEEIMKQG